VEVRPQATVHFHSRREQERGELLCDPPELRAQENSSRYAGYFLRYRDVNELVEGDTFGLCGFACLFHQRRLKS